jgi:putative transposase
MTPSASPNLYKHYRFPGEIISHAVWLYVCFPLSHPDVEELLFVRGVIVSYEAMRKWCRKFGQPYTNQLRRRCPRPGDKWHLDDVFISINKERHYLWRSIRTVWYSTSWCSDDGTSKRPRSSSASSSTA